MAAEAGAEGLAAADEDAGLARAVTGRAATLLVAELLGRAVDLAARLGLMGALLALVELPLDDPVDDVGAGLEPEDLRRQARCVPAVFASMV